MKNLTLAEVTEQIKGIAGTFGFSVLPDMFPQVIDPKEGRHVINFTTHQETTWAPDYKSAVVALRYSASIACMGGNPTPEDLMEAAEVIQAAACTVKSLNEANLAYTVILDR